MSSDAKQILMFYELYKIPMKYRHIMNQIIIDNRLVKKSFNRMLVYTRQQQLKKTLRHWEIIK